MSMVTSPRPCAPNVCALCRSQKRRCDKALPFCSRCRKLGIQCDYNFYVAEHGKAASSLPMHCPLALGQTWLPVSFHALQPYQGNLQDRRVDVDRFAVQLIMSSLAEHKVHLQEVLSAYFSLLQSWLPVVHEKRFRSRLSQLRYTPRADTALLLLCMHLAVKGVGNLPDDENARNQAYYICKYLFSFLQVVHPPSLELVQCGLLVTLFEVGDVLSSAASVSISTCARLGYALDLHVDRRTDLEDFSPAWVEAEERRRVWLGLFMVDRLVMQVTANCNAPHVVGVPSPTFRLPVPDAIWEQPIPSLQGEIPSATIATPVETRVPYLAREVQASTLLGQAQALVNIHDIQERIKTLEDLERKVIFMIQVLFEQSPGAWVVFCGANTICLQAMIKLQQVRVAEAPVLDPFYQQRYVEKSTLALSSTVNMISEICNRFNAVGTIREAELVPLPAVICTGVAALAEIQTNRPQANIDALKRTLELCGTKWKLARYYLNKLEAFERNRRDVA